MYDPHPVLVCEFSWIDPVSAPYSWDANGVSVSNTEESIPIEYVKKLLNSLKKEGKILDYGTREHQHVGFSLRIILPKKHADCLERFKFAMTLRWDKFQETQRREIEISEMAYVSTDWKRISSLY